MDPSLASLNSPVSSGNEIADRFGLLPNFFRLVANDPVITSNLWGFAQFAYLDNPLPSLFKERLFVYLSRFCEVRYCIARHLGFLVGLGRPAGDPACLPQTVDEVLPLLRCALPRGDALTPLVDACSNLESPISSYPAPDTPEERALLACATHVFLQTSDAARAHEALRQVLHPTHLEHLNVFLAFVRTAHYWTKLHPELIFEDDIVQLLNAHEVLANCILNDPEIHADGLSRKIAVERDSLEALKNQNADITKAFEALHTDHEELKENVQQQETNLRELVSAMPAAVYACDGSGSIVYWNRRAAELWGCEPELDGRPWSFLDSRTLYRHDGTHLDSEQTPVKQVFATGLPVVNQELVLERPDSSRVHILANIAPLRDASGFVWGAVNILQDITEIKGRQQEREQLLQELERSNRELSQFSFAVSHDLQAPVKSVRALTKLLVRRELAPSEDALELVALIEQASDGMQRLIESMLQYAQAGQGEVRRQTVSADAVVESVLASLASLIASTNARVRCHPLPVIDADPVQLHQVFQNLVANALKYYEPGRSPLIEIRGEPFEEGWRFTITDNGQGIPDEYRNMVFEPLKRLHGGETPGTGLGLAVCKAIILRHGGRIWVESKGAGQGTTFRFTLSREAPHSRAAGTTAAGRATSRAECA